MAIIDTDHENLKTNEPTQYVRNNPENEFVKDFMPIIMGTMIGRSNHVIAIPEVPYSYYSNEQIDMMVLDVQYKRFMLFEFKIGNIEKLKKQIMRSNLVCFGIIKSKKQFIHPRIFSDKESLRLSQVMLSKTSWNYIWESNVGFVYWWAYKNNESSFDGGRLSGSRDNFNTLYGKAIKNILIENPNLTHNEIYKMFGVFYSYSSSIKIFGIIPWRTTKFMLYFRYNIGGASGFYKVYWKI